MINITPFYKEKYQDSEELKKIEKYDRMNELEDKRKKLQIEMEEKLKKIDNEIREEFSDHKCIYKQTYDCPPYDYMYVCKICGHYKIR